MATERVLFHPLLVPPRDWSEDRRLLESWRAGDERALECLFERHVHAIVRFFQNKTIDAPEDLVQTTFLRMVEGQERLQDGQLFRAWLLGIARNVLREHLRELGRVRGRAVEPGSESMADLAPGPVTVLGRKAEHRLLLEALRAIPVDDQIMLELRYWEQLSSPDIATIYGISASAIRARLRAARAKLERELESLATTKQLLESTLDGLEGWAAHIRAELGRSGTEG